MQKANGTRTGFQVEKNADFAVEAFKENYRRLAGL